MTTPSQPERSSPPDDPVRLDRPGVRAGVRQSLPFFLGVLAYGLAYGVLSRQTGLSTLEVVLSCALVYAGSAQLIVLGFWVAPLPVGTIILTALVINLRYLLMSAALRPWLRHLSPFQVYGTLFFLTDEGWALVMSQFARGVRNAGALLGCGLALYAGWIGAALAGRTLGTALRDPARWGLDFAFIAVVIALLRGFWRGRADLVPWAAAALVAVVAHQTLPGTWYVVLGGGAGTLLGAARRAA